MANETLRGSCLCGAVQYEVEGSPMWMGHCHCAHCRKQHGSAFSTYAGWPSERFRFLSGQDRVKGYASSPGIARQFCEVCGSSLFFASEGNTAGVSIALGTLEGDPGMRAQMHIFVASKVPWYDIQDGLPQFDAYPPGMQPEQ